jgi:hypothetical protein
MSNGYRNLRDITLFLLGAGGFIHEVLATGTERPTILFTCLALMGVPAFLRSDEAKKLGNGDKGKNGN